MARVSICTSVYNQTNFLHGMIASVIGQSYPDWELIIVDDASTEDIAAEVAFWNEPRISLYHLRENKGVTHGLNHAFSLATGEYIQPLSADERIELNKIMWQVGYLDEHPEVGGIWGLPQNGELGERPEWEQYALKAHNRSRESWIKTLVNLENIPIGGASWLTRKSVLDDIGYFDHNFFKCSDLELFVRFFKKYEGKVFPYRWAWEDEEARKIPKTHSAEDFASEIAAVRTKHPLEIPKTQGRVTVAIPVRNMAKYIPATMKSLYAQSFQDFDIVILDDESTDDTQETMQICALEYPMPERTRFIQIKENIGPNAAQNHMLAECKTEFFVVLAADDTLESTFLEKCLSAYAGNPWLEFVGTQTDFIDKEGKPYTEEHPFKSIMRAANKPREVWLNQLYYGNQYFGCGMYRTQALKDVGGWDKDVGVIADYDVYLKMLMRGDIHVIEENLTHTRIHDENRSILKSKKEQLQLRKHYHTIKNRYYPPRQKVIIATPFYNMQGFSPYIMSLSNTLGLLYMSGISQVEFWELSGDSYVDRAKNTLMNKFLEDPDATDLFMIDSDMQWNPQSFLEMLQMPEEIVQGSYPQKNSWETWTARPVLHEKEGEPGKFHPIGRELANGSALIKAEFLAGGYIRIKRAAIEKYAEHYKDLTYYDIGADPSYPEREYIEFFTCERAKNDAGVNLRWGEDRVFGRRMQAIGIESWIYPKIDFGHYGIKGWMGNYDTHLKSGKAA